MVGSYNWILKCETPDARTFHSDHGLGNWKAFSVSPTPQCWMQSDLGFRDSWNKCDMILNVGYSSWASVALRFSGLCNSSSERKQYILKSCTGSPFLTLEVPASLTFKPPARTSWIRGRSAGWGPDTVPSILFLSHWIFPAVMLFPFYRDEAGTQRLELVSDGARMPTLTTICCPSQVAHFSLTPDVRAMQSGSPRWANLNALGTGAQSIAVVTLSLGTNVGLQMKRPIPLQAQTGFLRWPETPIRSGGLAGPRWSRICRPAASLGFADNRLHCFPWGLHHEGFPNKHAVLLPGNPVPSEILT